MASWLKVAEDLFEVVDRRAKLVASELSEEQYDSQSSASKGQEALTGRRKLNVKAQRRLSTAESPDNNDLEQEHIRKHKFADIAVNANDSTPASETSVALHVDLTEKVSIESPSHADAGHAKITSTETKPDDVRKTDADNRLEASRAENDLDSFPSSFYKDDVLADNTTGHEKSPTLQSETLKVESLNTHPHVSAAAHPNLINGDGSSSNVGRVPENETEELHVNQNFQGKQTDALEPHPKTEQGAKIVTSHSKVQDQLDEAQGLLESTNSTGHSKEARLARVCAGLSTRLQEYKSENAQLEELLTAERELSSSYEARIKQLQQELSESRNALGKIESNMADALAAKNSENEALQNAMDELKKQAADSEGKLVSLQADMETITRSRELTETRMMQALREELASAERRAEEEHTAHNATKMAAMEREVELERRAVETSTALARIQRTLDERTSKAADLEQKLALLEVECASLNQELQDMETRARRGEKRPPEEANQMLKIQAWQEEVERARQGQRDAESKLSNMEAELQKMRVEMAGMKRDAEHYSRQEHVELEKRYRELTDLLYYKQTQLEAMASEKAAAEFQLEKEAKRFQEEQVEAERNSTSRRASSSWEEENDLKSLESLPLHHRHMVGASVQLQKAVKLIDSGAVRATRFLWRYPVARVILVFYMVFVHFFLMYLLHRLQEQADSFAAKEVAASMGLTTSVVP